METNMISRSNTPRQHGTAPPSHAELNASVVRMWVGWAAGEGCPGILDPTETKIPEGAGLLEMTEGFSLVD